MRAAPFACCALAAMPGRVKEREGVTSQPVIEAGGKQLNLMGMGLRKKFIFKVYIASFYLEEPTEDAALAMGCAVALDGKPKAGMGVHLADVDGAPAWDVDPSTPFGWT